MKKILHFLMLSCDKATQLIEKKLLFDLSFREKIQLKMHKSICDACTTYEKQSKIIEEALQSKIQPNNPEQIDIIQNDSLKEKILNKLS